MKYKYYRRNEFLYRVNQESSAVAYYGRAGLWLDSAASRQTVESGIPTTIVPLTEAEAREQFPKAFV